MSQFYGQLEGMCEGVRVRGEGRRGGPIMEIVGKYIEFTYCRKFLLPEVETLD